MTVLPQKMTSAHDQEQDQVESASAATAAGVRVPSSPRWSWNRTTVLDKLVLGRTRRKISTPTFSIPTRRGLPPNLTAQALEEVLDDQVEDGYLVNIPIGDIVATNGKKILVPTSGTGSRDGANGEGDCHGCYLEGENKTSEVEDYLGYNNTSNTSSSSTSSLDSSSRAPGRAVLYLGFRDGLTPPTKRAELNGGVSQLLADTGSLLKAPTSVSPTSGPPMTGVSEVEAQLVEKDQITATTANGLEEASKVVVFKKKKRRVMAVDELPGINTTGAKPTNGMSQQKGGNKNQNQKGNGKTSSSMLTIKDCFSREPKMVATDAQTGAKSIAIKDGMNKKDIKVNIGTGATTTTTPTASVENIRSKAETSTTDPKPKATEQNQKTPQPDVPTSKKQISSTLKPVTLENTLHGSQKIEEKDVCLLAKNFTFATQPSEEIACQVGRNRAQRSVERSRDGWKEISTTTSQSCQAKDLRADTPSFLYSIQGGAFEGLRVIASKNATTNSRNSCSNYSIKHVAPAGFAIGGLGLGESFSDRMRVVDTVVKSLPDYIISATFQKQKNGGGEEKSAGNGDGEVRSLADQVEQTQQTALHLLQPRFLQLGACGDVIDVLEMADKIDVFELSFPFHAANHGVALTFDVSMDDVVTAEAMSMTSSSAETTTSSVKPWCVDLNEKQMADEFTPIDPNGEHTHKNVEEHYTRAYLHHLLGLQELVAYIWLTRHNLRKYRALFAEIRKHLRAGTFLEYRLWFYTRHGIDVGEVEGWRTA
ncbi:unnamed protein product [Amoebophrya sp. A25]|nr:unnamed protein product [Amoebophrya sp. A25]|eukprot:GSA25T00025479001.1